MLQTRLTLRRLIFAVTSMVLVVVGIAAAGQSASANDGVCGPGDLCLWEGTYMHNGQWDDSGWVANYASGQRWWGTNRSINDQASSMESRYSYFKAKVWDHSYYRGASIWLSPGGKIYDLDAYGFDDRFSSNNY